MPTLLSVSASVPRPIAFTFRPKYTNSLLVQFDFLPTTVHVYIGIFSCFGLQVFSYLKKIFIHNLVLSCILGDAAMRTAFADFIPSQHAEDIVLHFLSVCPSQ